MDNKNIKNKESRWAKFAEERRKDKSRNTPESIELGRIMQEASKEFRDGFNL